MCGATQIVLQQLQHHCTGHDAINATTNITIAIDNACINISNTV